MSNLTEAADAIRRQLKTMESWRAAADALDRLGSLEQAEREAQDRLTQIEGKATEAGEQLSQVEQDLATAQSSQMAVLEQTRERAARIAADAEASAAVVVADAQARADAVKAEAEGQAERARSQAEQVKAEAATVMESAKKAVEGANDVLASRLAEIAELDARISKARGRIAELLKD